jgi:hypothetical protein
MLLGEKLSFDLAGVVTGDTYDVQLVERNGRFEPRHETHC